MALHVQPLVSRYCLLFMFIIGVHMVFSKAEGLTYSRCYSGPPTITFSCYAGYVIDIHTAIISTSQDWAPGIPCPYTNKTCTMNSTDTYKLCDGRNTCNMSQKVMHKDPGYQCQPTNFIQINYTCENGSDSGHPVNPDAGLDLNSITENPSISNENHSVSEMSLTATIASTVVGVILVVLIAAVGTVVTLRRKNCFPRYSMSHTPKASDEKEKYVNNVYIQHPLGLKENVEMFDNANYRSFDEMIEMDDTGTSDEHRGDSVYHTIEEDQMENLQDEIHVASPYENVDIEMNHNIAFDGDDIKTNDSQVLVNEITINNHGDYSFIEISDEEEV